MKQLEIEFRGKRKNGNEWLIGDLNHIDGLVFIFPRNTTDSNSPDYYEVVPETVGQFIGKKDKKGIKIYEKDFLLDEYPIDYDDPELGSNYSYLPVVWCSEKLQWCIDGSFKKDGSCLTSLTEYFGEFLEVAGNTIDNPELLKQ